MNNTRTTILLIVVALSAFTIGLSVDSQTNPLSAPEDTPQQESDDPTLAASASVTFDEQEGEQLIVQLVAVQTGDAVRVETDKGVGEVSGGEGPNGTYLLDGDNGGVGETVTVDISNTTGGTVSVIGTVDGRDTVVQTYEVES